MESRQDTRRRLKLNLQDGKYKDKEVEGRNGTKWTIERLEHAIKSKSTRKHKPNQKSAQWDLRHFKKAECDWMSGGTWLEVIIFQYSTTSQGLSSIFARNLPMVKLGEGFSSQDTF